MSSIQPITLPKWGLEMSEGTVVAWHLEEGRDVAKGVELCDIETEKIVNTLDAERAGVLRRCVAKLGETLPVGALIAVVAPSDVPEAEISAFVAGFQPKSSMGGEPAPSAPEPAAPVLSETELRARNETAHASPIARKLANTLRLDLSTVAGTGKGGRISQEDVERIAGARAQPVAPELPPAPEAPVAPAAFAGPAARKLASETGVDIETVVATGVKGRVSKEDVRAAADERSAPATPSDGVFVPFTSLRKSIGQALVRAKQSVPHFYVTADVAVDEVLALRQRLNDRAGADTKISLNDFVLKAAAAALAEVSDVNVHVSDTGVTGFARADIAIAVAIEGGLIAPVLRDVGAKHIRAVAREAAQLAERARARKLTQAEIEGATFTVSNLGMFGVRQFDAIIAPPQGAILAIGAARREAFETDSGGIRFRSMLTVTLSCDHRAIDGATGARFLASFARAMQEPVGLLF